jgi:D-alanyl-D-alanine carboxypeptidase/D-alanyl-D-alanine-endopeptidase (penicillin-binding protein 4)
MPSDVEDAAGNRRVTISGSFPIDSRPILYAYPVPSARRFAEIAFTQALNDTGLVIPSPSRGPNLVILNSSKDVASSYTPDNIIATHLSPPLSEDVKITLKVSDNLHAAMMPYLWGALLAHDKTDPQAAGFKLERAFLARAGFDPLEFAQNDGEGAFAFFRPSHIVKILAYVARQSYFNDLYRGLPVLGVDGTLFNIQNGAPGAGKVHAKTGTNGGTDMLNSSRLFLTGKGLAGYMTTRSGHRLAFCLYLNNYAGPPSEDVTHTAGQILGEIANDGYVDL